MQTPFKPEYTRNLVKAKWTVKGIAINMVIDNSVPDDRYAWKNKQYHITETWIPALKYAIATDTLHGETEPVKLSLDSYLMLRAAVKNLFDTIEEANAIDP